MKKFLAWVLAINKRYDQIEEPRRFIVAMATMMPGVALLACDVETHPVLFLSGFVYLAGMLSGRLYYMKPRKV